jgi:hypothetical protein
MTSSINPNNIDGAYPVAGQDNDSQGFRDNFTNIKTNFGYAALEIDDLQSKAVLKSALTGTVLNNDMGGSILSNAQLQDMSGTLVALGSVSGSQIINYPAGPYQTLTTAGSVSLSFTNFPAAGIAGSITVRVTVTNTAYTLTLPAAVGSGVAAASVLGIEGIASNVITFAETGTYEFQFHTTDGGSTIYLSELTRPRNYFTNGVTVTGGITITGGLTVATISATGNITGGNITTAGTATLGNVSTSGNLTVTGNITGGNITTAGNITGGNITTAGTATLGSVDTSGTVQAAILNATGNITGGNVTTAGIANLTTIQSTTVDATGNVTAGNITTAGTINATGNISGGNISTSTATITTGDITTINSGLLQNGNSNITLTANGNVSIQAAGSTVELVVTSTGANVAGTFNATGNANVGNIGATNGVFTGNISGNTNGFTIGYLNIPQVAAANATLALTDAGKHYYSTTAGNLTLTVPLNSSVAFATGTEIGIVVQAAGNILVNAAGGVTLYMAGNSTAANRVVGSYGTATLLKVASDTWFISGTGVA